MNIRCQSCDSVNDVSNLTDEIYCTNCGTVIDFDSIEVKEQLGQDIFSEKNEKKKGRGFWKTIKKYLTPISIVVASVIFAFVAIIIYTDASYEKEKRQRKEDELKYMEVKRKECEFLSDGVREKWNNVMGVTYGEFYRECVVTYTDTDTGEVRTSPLSSMSTAE